VPSRPTHANKQHANSHYVVFPFRIHRRRRVIHPQQPEEMFHSHDARDRGGPFPSYANDHAHHNYVHDDLPFSLHREFYDREMFHVHDHDHAHHNYVHDLLPISLHREFYDRETFHVHVHAHDHAHHNYVHDLLLFSLHHEFYVHDHAHHHALHHIYVHGRVNDRDRDHLL
jgi:hypothetical protein